MINDVKLSKNNTLSFTQLLECLKTACLMLNPCIQIKNPVMFVTYIGSIVTTLYTLEESFTKTLDLFHLQIAIWLWFTVLFANFAQSLAESKGKAQAASLRKSQMETFTKKIIEGKEITISTSELKKGDVILCYTNDIIPADGEVIQGVATVDESAITGESAPVIRESGGDRSAVTAGTRVVSDQLKILVTSEKGNSFLDHMIQMIEGAKRQKTPNEIALNILLSSLTIIFLIAVVSLKFFVDYTSISEQTTASHLINIPILVSLLVCLIPTTISALLSAVGIAGMNRLISCNVVARSGRSVEAAGDVDLLILDKTGTITIGNRMATEFIPSPGISESEMGTIAQLASLSDETPEGRSIVVLAKKQFTLRAESLEIQYSTFIPFSAITRMSGIDIADEKGQVIRQIRKGALDAIISHIESLNGKCSQETLNIAQGIAKKGGTPLIVSDNNKIIGVICLKDIIKGGIQERFKEMRTMGIRTLMITGDNPLTAAAIAAESGVDDFVAEATPEIKLNIIKEAQQQGHLVAMTGDGTNDAPALAQADVGVAMNTGTQASREAGNMVDLDSNPTKLINIVEIGKQLLMTRGALTTFSITNDIAKYFAIIPAIFGALYLIEGHSKGPLSLLNVMNLHSHKSAILSAVIFNALIIVALIPLALRGVNYKAQSANQLLLKNMLIYGLGGIITPFIFIKLIDLFLNILDII